MKWPNKLQKLVLTRWTDEVTFRKAIIPKKEVKKSNYYYFSLYFSGRFSVDMLSVWLRITAISNRHCLILGCACSSQLAHHNALLHKSGSRGEPHLTTSSPSLPVAPLSELPRAQDCTGDRSRTVMWPPSQTHPRSAHRSTFFHPLLPFPSLIRSTTPVPPVTTCPLPVLGYASAVAPHGIGYGADAWSDHFSSLSAPTARGHRLFLQRWLPRRLKRPRGVVHVVHGLGDHSSKYAEVAKAFVKAGYAVLAHDAHGHGRSDGFRGHADSVNEYVEDAQRAISEGERRLPRRVAGLPRFLVAHSLGGAVGIHMVVREKDVDDKRWAGVVLTAPAVSVYPNPLLKLFAPVIAAVAPLMPVQRLKFGKKRRKGNADALRDPLVRRAPIRAKLGYEVLKSCEIIEREAGKFMAPLLIAHSKGDRVTNSAGSLKFRNMVGSADKTLKLYEGQAHDLMVESEERRKVIADILAWTDQRAEAFADRNR